MKTLIILASYNGGKYIKAQIDSILAQEGVAINLKIFDDGSSDNTLAVLKVFNGDSRVEVFENKVASGSAAVNFLNAIQKFSIDSIEEYDFVGFADQDDLWLPRKIIEAKNFLQKEGGLLYCSNLTKWVTATDKFSLLKKDFPQKEFDYLFEGGSAGCTYVFTTQFARELQFFLKGVDIKSWKGLSHDWLIYFFSRSRKFKVLIDPNSYIHYRLHDANVHGHLNQLSLRTIKDKANEVFNGYYQKQLKNYIKYVDSSSEEFRIYTHFLNGYFSRNFIIWKYNTKLMRDKKKLAIFLILNILKV